MASVTSLEGELQRLYEQYESNLLPKPVRPARRPGWPRWLCLRAAPPHRRFPVLTSHRRLPPTAQMYLKGIEAAMQRFDRQMNVAAGLPVDAKPAQGELSPAESLISFSAAQKVDGGSDGGDEISTPPTEPHDDAAVAGEAEVVVPSATSAQAAIEQARNPKVPPLLPAAAAPAAAAAAAAPTGAAAWPPVLLPRRLLLLLPAAAGHVPAAAADGRVSGSCSRRNPGPVRAAPAQAGRRIQSPRRRAPSRTCCMRTTPSRR